MGRYKWTPAASIDGQEGNPSAPKLFNVVIPRAPVTLTPSGATPDRTPLLYWRPVEGATRYRYEIWEGSGANAVRVAQDSGSPSCTGSGASARCEGLPLSLFLSNRSLNLGIHTWRVQAEVEGSVGNWSAFKTFNVTLPSGPPTLQPTGNVRDATPSYVWEPVEGATSYDVEILKGTGNTAQRVLLIEQITPGACSGDGAAARCSTTPNTALELGAHRWRVRTHYNGWAGDWSRPAVFTVVPPAAPQTVAPSGTIFDHNPDFTWKPVEGADEYAFNLQGGPNNGDITVGEIRADQACTGTGAQAVCSLTRAGRTVILDDGDYKWRVQASAAGHPGSWSAFRVFSIRPASAPEPLSPSGNTTNPTPSYHWRGIARADRYAVEVFKSSGAAATRVFFKNTAAADVCEELRPGEVRCTVDPDPNRVLELGSHTWRVQAIFDNEAGAWSAPRAFTVILPRPTTISPTGSTRDRTPAFVWQAIVGVDTYDLEVKQGATAVLSRSGIAAADVCPFGGAGTCSFTSNMTFPHGTYTWQLRATAAGRSGDWSAARSFTIRP